MSLILLWMLLTIFVSAVILAISIQKRDAPKSLYFIILSLLITFYVTGRFFEASASGLEAGYLGTILGYIGLPFVPLALLLFILDYYNIEIKKWLMIFLSVPPLITSLLVSTPSLRKYYYIEYSYFPGPPIAQIMVEGNTYYYIFFCYYFLLLVVCMGFSLWGAIKYSKVERWPSLAVLISAFLPTFVGILYMLKLTPLNLDIAPFALCFSLMLLGLAVHRLNLLKVLPLAKDMILEQMNDAFIIVGKENRYVESNSSAKKLFTILSDMRIGQKMDIADLLPQLTEDLDGTTFGSVMFGETQQYFHLSKTEVIQNGRELCTCYTLHDLTDTRKLITELKSLSTYDTLTNIYNRASFYQLAAHELDLARRQKNPVSAFEIDIDYFKKINDTYGHFCGDEIIKGVVSRIAGRLRGSDIFGRVGGEEFNVLLPDTNLDNAMTLAQTLQHIVESETFSFEAHTIPVTISVGVAVFEAHRHADLEHLLMDVDSALYESKNTGRNKVCVYRPV